MEQQKDYSLLRQFDMEAAKRGEAICFQGIESSTSVTYIAGPDKGANIICDVGGYFKEYFHTALRMKPLCWVEGKPVYKGDVLFNPTGVAVRRVVSRALGGDEVLCDDGLSDPIIALTWTQPKVKLEVKLVAFIDDQGSLRWVREELFRGALVRVPSEDKTIVIEE